MKTYDYIIVGGGIGGAISGAYLSQFSSTLLLEKEPYLGGCSGSFSRGQFRFNIGATTFGMYQDGLFVKDFFDKLDIHFPLQKLQIPLCVIQGQKTINRYQDKNSFIKHIQTVYPHPNHEIFWNKIYEIATLFYQKQDLFYDKSTPLNTIKTLINLSFNFYDFFSLFLQDAQQGLDGYFGDDLGEEFYDFLNAQLLIVAQTTIDKTNFLTLALALSYTFFDNFYVVGGMGELFNSIEKKIAEVHKQESYIRYEKTGSLYTVYTSKNTYTTKNLIFNTAHHKQFIQQKKLTQSAFVVYLAIKTNKTFLHHYQIIADKIFENTISKSYFVSFSDQNDEQMAPNGYYSVTISIHTSTLFWENLDKQTYNKQKESLLQAILDHFCATLQIQKDEIINAFGATPNTFQRYINRSVLGGLPLNRANFLLGFDSPKKGDLYYCGDNVFPAQGWIGVMSGVKNLIKVMNV